MTLVRLMDAVNKRPFRPFTLNVMDGRSLAVTHPEAISFYDNERSFNPYRPDGVVHVLDSGLVIDIEFPASEPA